MHERQHKCATSKLARQASINTEGTYDSTYAQPQIAQAKEPRHRHSLAPWTSMKNPLTYSNTQKYLTTYPTGGESE